MVQALEEKRTIPLDEEAARALEALVETAVHLKRSGLLDMLRVIAEKSDELLAMIANDTGVQRSLGLIHAAYTAMEHRVSPDEIREAKPLIELFTGCTVKAMAATDPAKAKPVGLFGLMGALRDKDVQAGLAVLLALAKNLGACIRSETSKKQ